MNTTTLAPPAPTNERADLIADTIEEAITRAAGGSATRVAIVGCPSSGRTRRIDDARRAAVHRGVRTLSTHGQPADAEVPYAALLTLLAPCIDAFDALRPAEVDSITAALELRPQDVDRSAIRSGLWRLLNLLSDESTVLITLDASELIDPDSASTLAFALGRLADQPVAVVIGADHHNADGVLMSIADTTIAIDEPDGDLRSSALAHQRAATAADDPSERAARQRSALRAWTATLDVASMREGLAQLDDGSVESAIVRSAVVRTLDGDAAAVEELRRAAAQADQAERVMLDALFADAALSCGRVREAAVAATRALAHGEPQAAHNLAQALLVIIGFAGATDLDELVRSGDEVVASRAALRHAEVWLRHGVPANADAALANPPDAASPWTRVDEIALRARIDAWRGDASSARRHVGDALRWLPRDAEIARAVLRSVDAEVQFLLGEGEAAVTVIEEVVPILEGAGMTRAEAAARTTIGRVAWSVGETDVAIAALEQARRVDPTAPVGDLVVLLASTHREREARAWMAKLDSRRTPFGGPIDVQRARAFVADDPAALGELVDRLRAAELVVYEAEVAIDQTALFHRRRSWPELMEAAERAVRLMVPTGTKAWIARLDALEPPSSDADQCPAALSTLTAAERRVAMAVGGGLTNKEAADELFVSVKTIDSHLQRIYPKLQIRSRSELAAIVNDRRR